VLKVLSTFFIFFFLSPFLILISHLDKFILPENEELFWALKNSFFQSMLSLGICFIVGIILLEGIFYLRKKINNKFAILFFEFSILLPSFLPALFSLLVFLSVLQPFPFGLTGVSLIHGFTYAGLFAVMLVRILENQARGFFEVSYLLGAQKIQMYFQAFRMLKADLFYLSILVFTICFTSFSVPVAVGGGRGTTLEILIYEKMRLSGEWSQALILSLIQSVFIAAITIFFLRKRSTQLISRSQSIQFLGGIFPFLLTVCYLFLFLGGFLYFSMSGWDQVFSIPNLWTEALSTVSSTVVLGIGAGFITLLFFLFSTIALYQNSLQKFLLSYLAPSVSLMGLSVILLSPENHKTEILFYLFSTILLFFCGLYKMGFEQILSGLRRQVEVSTLLGASAAQTLFRVVIPQVLPTALNLSGIAALWVVGDFALCKAIFTHDFLLAQMIEGLMSSYRIEAATALMGLLIFIGFLVYILFAGVGYVYRYQSHQKV